MLKSIQFYKPEIINWKLLEAFSWLAINSLLIFSHSTFLNQTYFQYTKYIKTLQPIFNITIYGPHTLKLITKKTYKNINITDLLKDYNVVSNNNNKQEIIIKWNLTNPCNLNLKFLADIKKTPIKSNKNYYNKAYKFCYMVNKTKNKLN